MPPPRAFTRRSQQLGQAATLLIVLLVASCYSIIAESTERIVTVEKAGKADVDAFFRSDRFWEDVFERVPALIHTDGFFLDGSLSPAELFTGHEFIYEGDASKEKSFRAYNKGFYAKGKMPKLSAGAVAKGEEVVTALEEGFTVVFQQCHRWSKSTKGMAARLADYFGRRASVNCYLAAPSMEMGMDAHNDQHDFVIVQVHGMKRWMMWTDKEKMLPLGEFHEAHGTREDTKLHMGEPEIDIVLRPGDLLYVPRGTIHLTSTSVEECDREEHASLSGRQKLEKLASLHLTVAIALDSFALPWVMGAATVSRIPQHSYFTEAYQLAVQQINSRSLDLRRSVSLKRKWKEKVRQAMHLAVDEVIDNTDFLANVEERLQYVLEVGRQQTG